MPGQAMSFARIAPARSLAAQYSPAVKKILARAAASSILLVCVLGITHLAFQVPNLFLLDDVDYGDSYVLHDLQRFHKTGIIYHDLSRPPYTPSVYGPMLYVLFSLPGKSLTGENPFVGPRLIAILTFGLCILLIASITRALVGLRRGWIWAILLAGSITCMHLWVLQIRGDFPAILLSLAAVRLLLIGSPRAIVFAGILAGFVTLFKFTMVAALAAGIIWLLVRRLWMDLARFTIAGCVASAGLYLLWAVREPRMVAQILSLRIGHVDVAGEIASLHTVFTEPVVLLAIAAIPLFVRRISPRWGLLILFIAISFAIAGITDLHPGANINYFYEALFAAVPAAVLGVWRLLSWARRHFAAGLLISLVFIWQFAYPTGESLYHWKSDDGLHHVSAANARFRQLEEMLRGQHIFSTVERLALLDPEPALVSAFNWWAINPTAIYQRLGSSEFDVVLTRTPKASWRGIDHVQPGLRKAISDSYVPYCALNGILVQLPRERSGANADVFRDQLSRAGCMSVAANPKGFTW